MAPGSNVAAHVARPLEADDLERVVAIDHAHAGQSRRHFFEKRLAAARLHPDDFIQVGVTRSGVLSGFAVARIQRGEFGREPTTAVLEAMGVEPESRHLGVGQLLMAELAKVAQGKGVRSLQSQVDWKDQDLLRFFAASGFELAPRLALERQVGELPDEPEED